MKFIVGFFIFFLWNTPVYGQDHFYVAIEIFEPEEQEIIKALHGSIVESFLAKDTKDKSHYSKDYTGQNLLLWFWSSDDEMSMKYSTLIKELSTTYKKQLQIFGFTNDNRSDLAKIEENLSLTFPNFPQSEKLGEVAYAGELGLNRMFFIDKTGTIKEILPRSFFRERSTSQSKEVIDAILSKL